MENQTDTSTTALSISNNGNDQFLFTVTLKLWQIFSPIFLMFGTVFNILSFVVFCHKSMRQSVTSMLFRILAILDFLFIYAHPMPAVFYYLFGIEIFTRNNLTCKVFWFWLNSSRALSSWVLVFISVERLICVYEPHLAKIKFTKERAFIGISVICIIVIGLCMFIPFIVETFILRDNQGNVVQRFCKATGLNSPFLRYYADYVFPWVDFFLYTGIPFVCMLICNVAIIINLNIAKRKRQNVTHNAEQSKSQTHGLTAMLLTVSFAFLLQTASINIYFISNYTIISPWVYMWNSVSFLLLYANHSINFLLYCISGKRFRDALMQILHCKADL